MMLKEGLSPPSQIRDKAWLKSKPPASDFLKKKVDHTVLLSIRVLKGETND